MAWPSDAIDDLLGTGVGAVDVTTRAFAGSAGLAELNGPLGVSTPPGHEFSATLTRAAFRGGALERFVATPHTVHRGPAQMTAAPVGLIAIVFIESGVLDVRQQGFGYAAQGGDVLLMDTRAVTTSTASTAVDLLRAVITVDQVPAALQREAITLPGPLPRTALLAGYRDLVDVILRPAAAPRRAGSTPRLEAVVSGLHAAVLADALDAARSPDAPAALRHRIELFIRRHHTDPDLDVNGIARALHVSVRHAHSVFDDGDRTIGRVLRDRRADTAARLLLTADLAVHLEDIARQAGFSGRDALNHAFQHLFGTTARCYADQHRRARPD